MTFAPSRLDEAARLDALRDLAILDTGPEEVFDRITRLASRLLQAPVASLNLIDAEREWCKSASGPAACERPRSEAFCAHAILLDEALCVNDASADERFRDNPQVTVEGVRAYLGAPLRSPGGQSIGALCVKDFKPRRFTPDDIRTINELAWLAMNELRHRQSRHRLDASEQDLERASKVAGLLSKAVRETDQNLQRIIDMALDAVVSMDTAGRITGWNEQAAVIFGWTREEAIGRDMGETIVPERHRAAHAAGLQRYLAGGGAKVMGRRIEIEAMRRDGSEFPAELSISPIRVGDSLLFSAFIRDISDRRRAQRDLESRQAELEEARARAEAANRAKSEFLANMSHELRTPLTAILGFTDLIDEPDATPEAVKDCVGTIRRNGEHLLTVINDILDLSKIESGRIACHLAPCSPLDIAADVASLLRVHAQAKGLTLEVRTRGPVPERIMTDPVRLRQILLNLAGNAVKFTDRGGVRLEVGLQSAGPGTSDLRIDIHDTGIGMDAGQTARLFQPFTQADASATRRFGGAGLGLSVSRRLAALLGGDIVVASTPGVGSTFTLTIAAGEVDAANPPASEPSDSRPAAPSAERDPAAPAGEPPLGSFRILLAEDGPENQRLISHHLRKAGADVMVADNGRAAVELLLPAFSEGAGSRLFDLVLMDMQMPELDGYEATRRLRGEGYGGPIVALTAHAMDGDREKCLQAGCDDYLTKPISSRLLIETARRWSTHGRTDSKASSRPEALRTAP